MPFRTAAAAALALLSSSAFAQTASAPHLIPMPREFHAKADIPLAKGVQVSCIGCDADDTFAADDLSRTLRDRGIPTGGFRIVLQRLAQHPDAAFTEAMKPEGYTITSTPSALTLTAATPEGVFYAAQTAKQLIEATSPNTFVLHAADIRDWPAMKYRGLHDDLARGPVDTLDFQKKIIRTLAAYKDNVYSPYFEHTQQYASNPLAAPPGGAMSAADARELVAYARHFHITVIPEQEAFGHLHHMLKFEQYQALAETPHGAVLAPGQPGSLTVISQMFTELAQLYPSPFLHIGADETFELGLGQTKSAVDTQGLGKVYLDFMQGIDTTLRPLHRRLLFWGDIAQDSPDLLKAMPQQFKQDTIAIGWQYNPNPNGFARYLKPYTDAGFETWVASGINNWSRVYPNNNYALLNIQQFTRDGQRMGATGQLNTIWYDDGEALASNNWYGILFGAAAAWQPGESSIDQFQNTYAQVFHGDLTGKLNDAQRELIACHMLLKNSTTLGDGSDGLFWIDPWSHDGQNMAPKLRPVLTELRTHAERALTLIAEARAAAPPAPAHVAAIGTAIEAVRNPDGSITTTESLAPEPQPAPRAATVKATPLDPRYLLPSNPTSLREPDAIDALELGARRFDFLGLKFQLADEMASGYARALAAQTATDRKSRLAVAHELNDINGVNGRIQDIKDGYSLLRDLYQQLWLRTNRPYGLRPVLEHYDATIGLWIQRMDKLRAAQRQWAESHTIPPAAELGIPAPASPSSSPPQPVSPPLPAASSSSAPQHATGHQHGHR